MNVMTHYAESILLRLLNVTQHQNYSDSIGLQHEFNALLQQWFDVLQRENINTQLIQAGHYCLCCAIDETILSTPWGANSIWQQQTLLSQHYYDTSGGERFYTILETFIHAPQQYLILLELQYVLLSLGFQGKYFNQGQLIRDEIRQRTFLALSKYYAKDSHALYFYCIPTLNSKKPWWRRYNLIGLALCIGLGGILNLIAYYQHQSIRASISHIATRSANTFYNTLLRQERDS